MTEWEQDCLKWYNRVLTGRFKHYCPDWDFLPIDELSPEFEFCHCEFDWEDDDV